VLVLHRWSDVAAVGDAGSAIANAHKDCYESARRPGSFVNRLMKPRDGRRVRLHRREERYLSALPKGAR